MSDRPKRQRKPVAKFGDDEDLYYPKKRKREDSEDEARPTKKGKKGKKEKKEKEEDAGDSEWTYIKTHTEATKQGTRKEVEMTLALSNPNVLPPGLEEKLREYDVDGSFTHKPLKLSGFPTCLLGQLVDVRLVAWTRGYVNSQRQVFNWRVYLRCSDYLEGDKKFQKGGFGGRRYGDWKPISTTATLTLKDIPGSEFVKG